MTEQRQAEYVVDDDPRRQQALTLLGLPVSMTRSTTSGGKTLVSTPIEMWSDNRWSVSGLTHPARGTGQNNTRVVLSKRYCS